MMEREHAERIARLLGTSLCDLVRSLGGEPVSLETGSPKTPETRTLAVSVEFGNEQTRGLFGLVAEKRLFTQLGPRPKVEGERFLTDWACEFASQAVGRFRNRARTYGLLFSTEPPQLSSQDDIHLSEASQPIRIPVAVGVDNMVLDAWIDLDGQSNVPLSELPNEEVAAEMPDHGDVLLF